ncbi:hypothetical protein MN116_001579, partial [Schistosoma mekongi]
MMILFRASEIMHGFMLQFNEWRYFSTKLTHEAMKAFEILGISSSSTPEECKKAYLNFVRSIHPDVQNDSIDIDGNIDLQKKANTEFHRLHEAYTLAYGICANNHHSPGKDCRVKQLNNHVRKFRHTAYQSFYVDHISQTAEEQNQNAMNHGELKNLPGQGHAVDYNNNSYLFSDSTDKRLNQILANQGFLPKWVLLNKEVSSRWNAAIDELSSAYNEERNVNYSTWLKACEDFETEVKELNRLLDQYDLIVPSPQMQRFHLDSKTTDQLIRKKHSQIDEESKRVDHTTTGGQNKNDTQKSENDSQGVWDPRYMAAVIYDFYRELAKSFPIKAVSPMKTPTKENYMDRYIPLRTNARWKTSTSFEQPNNNPTRKLFQSSRGNIDGLSNDVDSSSQNAFQNHGFTSLTGESYTASAAVQESVLPTEPRGCDLLSALVANELEEASLGVVYSPLNSKCGFGSSGVLATRENNNMFSFKLRRESPCKLKTSPYTMSPVSEKSQQLLKFPQK